MSLEDFANIQKRRGNGNSAIEITRCKFDFPVSLTNTGLRSKRPPRVLKFSECIFSDIVEIGNKAEAGNIIFTNCEFEKRLNCSLENTTTDSSCKVHHLGLNINHEAELPSEFAEPTTSLTLNGATTNFKIKHLGTQSKIGRVIINLYIKALSIEDLHASNLELKSLDKNITTILISRSTVEKLVIDRCSVQSRIQVTRCMIEKLWIPSKADASGTLQINDNRIASLFLPIGSFPVISVFNNQIIDIVLSGPNEGKAVILFEKNYFQYLSFEKALNNGRITFVNMLPLKDSELRINSSSLGQSEFIATNFSSTKLIFDSSRISDCFLANTDFPDKVFLNGLQNSSQAQLFFGQLSIAYQKNGDTVRALYYGALEIESHYKNVRWKDGQILDSVTLYLNKWSNDFGRSWLRGIYFSFLVGLFFFGLLLLSTNQAIFEVPHNQTKIGSVFIKFMNPIRFFDLEQLFAGTPGEGKMDFSFMSSVFDLAGRIFVAYGYYQTVQAFRRFGRK